MIEIPFATLENAVTQGALSLAPNAKLTIAELPNPFIPPSLLSLAEVTRLGTEVVFIEAPAAVGKSTLARYLSAKRNIPLLDLSKVPVATGSLRALLADMSASNHLDLFHAGALPLIIDALDEGRLLSGDKAFEAFLQTTGELLASSRIELRKPKLIILGRGESIDLARVGLTLSSSSMTMSSVRVGFFGQDSARQMIDAYATRVAGADSAYRKNPIPASQLVDAYFDAIEAALGIEAGSLWSHDMGRAFAGYAPVLSALGLLLAEVDNFMEIANRLRDDGTHRAWGVIEEVLTKILEREKGKLCDQLATKINPPVPSEAYDPDEQLLFITQFVHKQSLRSSTRVRLNHKDRAAYESLVAAYLREHPFVREGKLENPVLGSVVLAHAVIHDLLAGADMSIIAALSKQPFLYRSVRKQLKPDSLVDGRYLGYILSSFWNEPVPQGDKVVIRTNGEGAATVLVSNRGHETILLTATLPITLFAHARDCDIDVDGAVELQGNARGSQSVFELAGEFTLICESLTIRADLVQMQGRVWLEAAQVGIPGKLDLDPKTGTKVGWGGELVDSYPWNRFTTTLGPPYQVAPQDRLTELVEECARRFAAASALTFGSDFSVSDDDRWKWAHRRAFAADLSMLIKLLLEHGFGTKAQVPVNQVQIHLSISWSDLLQAVKGQPSSAGLAGLVLAARARI